jgi:hypothetical protein
MGSVSSFRSVVEWKPIVSCASILDTQMPSGMYALDHPEQGTIEENSMDLNQLAVGF